MPPPLDRRIRILEAIAATPVALTPEELMQMLGVSRATVFRDLQQLASVGFVERLGGAGYSLGPRIVELDRQIRLHDPVLRAAAELPASLVRQTGGSVLICRLHGRSVICIQESGTHLLRNPLSYQRGRAMPLYRGATSKVILAHLRPSFLETLIREELPAMQAAGLPATPREIRALLAGWRADGFVVAHGDLDEGMTGIAVPLMRGARLLGSLSVVLPHQVATEAARGGIVNLLMQTARRIEARLDAL